MRKTASATTIQQSKERKKERKSFFSNPLKTTINFHFNGKAMTICGVSKWKIKAMNLKAKISSACRVFIYPLLQAKKKNFSSTFLYILNNKS